MTLSLAMIVRNEEANLRELLPMAAQHTDEIVIVDTGSTDGTRDVLDRHDCVVLEQPWEDNFAKPRNLGLEHVSTDWVLILDADERLSAEDWQRLHPLVGQHDVLAYECLVKNFQSDEDPNAFNYMRSFRLFQHGFGIRYEGAVHNQLGPSIEAARKASGLRLESVDVCVLHYGYALPEAQMRAKRERVYRMVTNALEQRPGDAFYLYHLLNVCHSMGRFEEARGALQRLNPEQLDPTLRVQALQKAAQVYLHFDQLGRAEAAIQAALKLNPDSVFSQYQRSHILMQQQRFPEALQCAQRALELSEQAGGQIANETMMAADELYFTVGMTALLNGRARQARQALRQTLAHNPEHAEAQAWLGKLAGRA